MKLAANLCVRTYEGNYCTVPNDDAQSECTHYVFQGGLPDRCTYAEWHRDSRYVCKCNAAISEARSEDKTGYTLCRKKKGEFVCLGAGFYSMSECEYSKMTLEKCKFSEYVGEGYFMCLNVSACFEAGLEEI